MLADKIAYETSLGYDRVKESVWEEQGGQKFQRILNDINNGVFKNFIFLKYYDYMIKNSYSSPLVVNSIFLACFLATDGSAESRDKCRVRGVGSLAGGRGVFGGHPGNWRVHLI